MGKYKRKRPTIGVLPGWQAYTGTLDSFLGEVLHGIQAAAHNHTCNLLLACGMSSTQIGIPGIPAWPIRDTGIEFLPVGHWNTDGLIMIPPVTFDSVQTYIQSLKDNHFPFVFAGDRESGPSIVVDNVGGIRQAIFHLYEHGHREIAFLTGNYSESTEGDARLRYRAFLAAMQELGLSVNPDLIADGRHNQLDGCRGMEKILRSGAHFTAVLASNDQSALGVIDALTQVGLLVPQDVALIGFDDRLEGRALEPALTTVHFPMFELGYRSVELLLKFIDGGIEPDTIIKIPTRLVTRESCGCIPGAMAQPRSNALAGLALNRRIRAKGPASEKPVRRGSTLQITQDMTGLVFNDLQRMNLKEVTALCQRLVEAFKSSLSYADATIFRLTTQQVLERVASAGDDLFAWQSAISVLGEHAEELMKGSPAEITRQQVESMLHQARVMVSEVSRGQYSRILLRKATMTDYFGRMTARFFSMQTESDLLDLVAKEIPTIGIRTAAVCFFEPEESDPNALSVALTPDLQGQRQRHFKTRTFPPAGFYAEDKIFDLAILPLSGLGDLNGYVAYETDDLEWCALVTRQLAAALWSIRLYCQALENRRLAEERRQAAEEANRLKSRFLSMVSHELRTPLNLISGLSDILLKNSLRFDRTDVVVSRQDLEKIYISSQHLDALIRDVLDLSSSDIGQLKLVREPLDVCEVLNAVTVIGEQLAANKDLSWSTQIGEDLPRIWGDRTRLRQVILNLVNNAVKFTSHGGITLTARLAADQIRISVVDTGLGIAMEEQALIFNEFHQSERTTTRGYGGLGLGLAICKRLVEMHGGQIYVDSTGEENAGSTFSVALPILHVRPALTEGILPLSEVKRVLILHKTAEDSQALKYDLTERGYEVKPCQVGDDAEWLACLLFTNPDAVILDLSITSDCGWEIIQTLKENPATQSLPVLFYSEGKDGQCGAFLEMNYLTKPLGADELSDTLASQGLLDPANGKGGAKNILVVDDEPEMLELHARLLASQSPGYKVLRAHNGRQALALMRQEHPALVLLDLMMPEMDGFEVLDSMREENLIPGIPVVVVTSQNLTAEDMARLNQGVTSILEKGMYSSQETMKSIADALARKRRPGSETQRIVLKALAYIHNHYTEPISRGELAGHIGLSERHLTRCFKQEVGMTPVTYLNRFRVKQAKVLLETGERGITEIAVDLGFSSNAYFSRVFQSEVGVSPRTYLQSKSKKTA